MRVFVCVLSHAKLLKIFAIQTTIPLPMINRQSSFDNSFEKFSNLTWAHFGRLPTSKNENQQCNRVLFYLLPVTFKHWKLHVFYLRRRDLLEYALQGIEDLQCITPNRMIRSFHFPFQN